MAENKSIVKFFRELTIKANKDLKRLEGISRTIQDFLNFPTKFISNRRKVENRQLKAIFDDISEMLVELPSILEGIQIKKRIHK